jgi:hypothetical protein
VIDDAVTPGADDPPDPDEPPDPDPDDEPHATANSPVATTVTAKTIHFSFGLRTSLLQVVIGYTAMVRPVRGSCPPKANLYKG